MTIVAELRSGLRRDRMAHEVPAEEWARWEFLRDAPKGDARDPALGEIASRLWLVAQVWGAPSRERQARTFGELALTLVARCLDYREDIDQFGVEDDIRGFTRPAESPMATVRRGGDDCDEKARLFAALCLSVGLPARMVSWWSSSGQFDHVSAELLVPLDAGGGSWEHAETILRRARLGEVADAVPYEANGKWLK
jgi:transglutaminase-like putative cysteine protease